MIVKGFFKIQMDYFAHFVLAVLFMVLALVPSVNAMSAGDVIALLVGLTLGILGICACLGHYARTRQNWFASYLLASHDSHCGQIFSLMLVGAGIRLCVILCR